MGNVFHRFGLVSVALLVCGACGEASSSEDENGAPAPYMGNASVQPAPGAMTPEQNANPEPAQPSATPSTGETPAANPNTPVAPAPMMGNTTPQTPPQQTPPQQTPPQQTLPQQMPPAQMPPMQMPPPQTPPAMARTQVFLLFGQSNMWGVPAPQQQDLEVNPRVEVLTITSCQRHGTNQWMPAQPPLHGCVGMPGGGGNGPGLGPGDYFGKALADAFPQDTILLVPAAVPGVSIDTFQPGQTNYNNLLNRARMSQDRGEIRGMIFHQGESDSGQASWPNRVKTVVDRLRADLGVASAPFVAGELLYSPAGCCGGHNTLVGQLPSVISNAAVARANGFAPVNNDGFGNLHFDVDSQREFGRRYGAAMIDLLTP